MTWTSAASGNWDPAGTTEESIVAAQTTNGTYVLVIDASNMTAGKTVEFWLKTKAKSGSTSRIAYHMIYFGLQTGDPNKYSIPVPVDTEILVTGKCDDATITFDYNLLRQ